MTPHCSSLDEWVDGGAVVHMENTEGGQVRFSFHVPFYSQEFHVLLSHRENHRLLRLKRDQSPTSLPLSNIDHLFTADKRSEERSILS